MAAEPNVGVTVGLVPRHYVIVVQAAIPPTAMVELMQAFELLAGHPGTEGLFDEGSCGGFFRELRTACAEEFTGDLPAPIGAPIAEGEGEEDEPEGGVAAKK